MRISKFHKAGAWLALVGALVAGPAIAADLPALSTQAQEHTRAITQTVIDQGAAIDALDARLDALEAWRATVGVPPVVDPPKPPVTDWAARPFKAESPWNTPVPAAAVLAPASDPRTAEIRRTSNGGSIVWAVNAQNYAINDFQAKPGDPTKRVRIKDYFGNRFDYTIDIPWPDGAHAAMGTDMSLAIRDADGVTSHEFWHFDESTNPPTAASYSRTRLDGTGWNLFPDRLPGTIAPHNRNPDEAIDGVGAGRAVSVSLLGGLITEADVERAAIEHVIALAVPRTYIRRGPRVWPADLTNSHYDGDATSTGPLAYSMLFALPADLDLESLGLSPEWLIVARAMQKYGLRIVDVSGKLNPNIYTAYPAAFKFGTALRNRQSVDFPKLWKRLHYVVE